jgi:methylmalonyl-CoA/ethylmalonyl-CoA epimerase
VLKALEGIVPFQVAFVVRDLEQAVAEFETLLDAGPWRGYVFDAGTVQGREYHGRPADWSFRVVLSDRRPQFELIEPLAGRNIFADWLDARGPGMHHIAYAVSSVEETTVQMAAAGHRAVQSGHSFGADRDGVFAHYDTAEALGFLIEAVEPPGRLPDPPFRL